MKIKFKDKRIAHGLGRWTVSGFVDTETNTIKATRIEGDITNTSGLMSALLMLALKLNP